MIVNTFDTKCSCIFTHPLFQVEVNCQAVDHFTVVCLVAWPLNESEVTLSL